MEEFALDVLGELIDFVKMASPELWRICARQAIAEGTADILLALVMFVASFITGGWIRKLFKNAVDDDDPSWFGMVCFVSLIFIAVAGVGVSNTLSGVKQLVNPEFYALKILAGMLPK